jgi:multiple antibiotic resistance protein
MTDIGTWNEYTRFLITLIAVLDPFMAVPVFLTITATRSPDATRHLARSVAVTVFLVLLVSAIGGEKLLELMGGSIASFRVGGGLVLLLMALAMLHAQTGHMRQTAEEEAEVAAGETSGVVPLAIPLLAGPGAISTVIIAVQHGGWIHRAIIVALIFAVCVLAWLAMRLATPIGRHLGTTGINIANRLLGLLLTAIAIETMAIGLRSLFPGLGG